MKLKKRMMGSEKEMIHQIACFVTAVLMPEKTEIDEEVQAEIKTWTDVVKKWVNIDYDEHIKQYKRRINYEL